MKYLFLLIVAAFLESAFLPINLVLCLLLVKLLLSGDSINMYICVFLGVLLGFLSMVNLGFYPLVFLVIYQLSGMLSRSQFSGHLLILSFFSAVIFWVVSFLEMSIFGVRFGVWKIVFEVGIFVLVYVLMSSFGSYLPKNKRLRLV